MKILVFFMLKSCLWLSEVTTVFAYCLLSLLPTSFQLYENSFRDLISPLLFKRTLAIRPASELYS